MRGRETSEHKTVGRLRFIFSHRRLFRVWKYFYYLFISVPFSVFWKFSIFQPEINFFWLPPLLLCIFLWLGCRLTDAVLSGATHNRISSFFSHEKSIQSESYIFFFGGENLVLDAKILLGALYFTAVFFLMHAGIILK